MFYFVYSSAQCGATITADTLTHTAAKWQLQKPDDYSPKSITSTPSMSLPFFPTRNFVSLLLFRSFFSFFFGSVSIEHQLITARNWHDLNCCTLVYNDYYSNWIWRQKDKMWLQRQVLEIFLKKEDSSSANNGLMIADVERLVKRQQSGETHLVLWFSVVFLATRWVDNRQPSDAPLP